MLRITLIIFSFIVLFISLTLSIFWPMAGWSLLVILPAFMLSVYDLLQSQ